MIAGEKVLFEKLTGMRGEVMSRIDGSVTRKPNDVMGLRVSRVANSTDIIMTFFHNGRNLGHIRMTEAEAKEHDKTRQEGD